MFRFTAKKDITMLKVALDYRPWDFGSKQWKIIAEKLRLEAGYDVTPRTCRLRTEYLIEQYKKHDMKCVRK